MPTVPLTENLRDTIKDLRKEKKKRGDELSREIGKGAAYISQVENGKIKEIDFDLLDKIFRRITDLPENQYEDFMNNLLDENGSHLSKEELQQEKWMHQFNHEIRKYPISDSLIEFIQNKLNELHYTPEEFVSVINQNRGLEGLEITEPNKLNIEIMDTGDGGYRVMSSIRFDLPSDFISKILLKEMKTISYINMQGILFNLFLSDNCSMDEAHIKTENLLFDNQFYTIRQRNKLIREKMKEKKSNNEKFTYYDVQPTDYDKQYSKMRDDIINGFNFLRDKDIVYACERLETLQKNMHDDLGFITAIMSAPLYKISAESKKKFWKDYANLVQSYINPKDDEDNEDNK